MESRKNTFVKQAAVLAAASMFVRFIGFLYRVPLTNMIGNTGNAYYNAGYQIYTFFWIMSSAGLPAAISRMVSERIALNQYREAHKVFHRALRIAAYGGLVSALIVLFGARPISIFLKQPLSYYSLLTLAPTLLIVGVMAVFRGYFQGMSNTVPTAVSQVAEQIFNAAFSVFLAWLLLPKGPEFGAAGGTAGTGIGALAGLLVMLLVYYSHRPTLRKQLKTGISPRGRSSPKRRTKSLTIEILQTAWPIILGTAIFSVSNIIDTIMVTDGLEATGIFTKQQADALFGQLSGKYTTLTTLPVSISTALAAAAIPAIASSAARKDQSAVNHKINQGIRLSMLISIPAAVGMSVLGDPIIRLLFPNYPDGGVLLRWGAASVIFLALANIITGMLQGIGRVRIPVLGAICGALVKIPLNFFLIRQPSINVVGAVLSTIGCYLVASAIDLFFLLKLTHAAIDFSNVFMKPVVGSVFMGLTCYVIYYSVHYISHSNAISTIVSMLVGIGVYFLAMLYMKGIDRRDLCAMPLGGRITAVMDRLRL